jgi:hypothetical protein
MAVATGIIAGIGIAALAGGALKSGNDQKKAAQQAAAAAEFHPFDVDTGLVQSTFEGQQATATPGSELQGFTDQISNIGSGSPINVQQHVGSQAMKKAIDSGLMGSFAGQNQQLDDNFFNQQQLIGGDVGRDMFGNQINQNIGLGDQQQQFAQGQVGGLLGAQQQQLGMVGQQQNIAGQQLGLGQQFGGLAGQQLGLAGNLQGLGTGLQNFAGTQVGQAQMQNQLGGNLLNQSIGDFSAQQQQQLDILRQQALPGQQRATNSALDRLFSSGQLGSTGGAQQVEALANAQNQQDLGFQNAAFGQATALRGQDIQSMLGQQQIGSGLVGQAGQSLASASNTLGQGANIFGQSGNALSGAGAAFQGVGAQQNAAVGTLGQAGQGLSNFANLGVTGQNIGSANIQNQLALQGGTQNLAGFLNQTGQQQTQLGVNAGQQRIDNLMNQFGFGQNLSTNAQGQTLNNLQGLLGIDTSLRNNIALGGNLGGTQAAAGANVGQALLQQGSPVGAGLTAVGGGLLSFAGGGGLAGIGGTGGLASTQGAQAIPALSGFGTAQNQIGQVPTFDF